MTKTRSTAILAALAAAALACSGGSSSSPASARAEIAVAVTPAHVELGPGASLVFAAVVTGTAETAVTWSVEEPSGGAVDEGGRYVAPPVEGTYHVRARSVADPAATAVATVVVAAAPGAPAPDPAPAPAPTPEPAPAPAPGAVALSVTPPSAAVSSCESVTFTGTVTGAGDTGVLWTVQEGAAGGTITSAGVYTAPELAGTYHVVGTSRADPTRSQVAEVVVMDRILSVQITPASVSLAPGQSAQFTAVVTTSCGSYTSSSTVTAPATAAN